MSLTITPELKVQLQLLAFIDPEHVSDLILALIETIDGIRQDPDDMPYPIRTAYLYWTSDGRINSITSKLSD